MIRSLLIVLAMLIGTTAYAQEGLPKFVQGLSDAEYATWAAWQNRQAKLRATEESENSDEEPYIYAVRTTAAVSRGVVEVETMPQRYANPAFKPPGSVTIHNPYARFVKNRGAPNWNKLFVPCTGGTMTVAEALNKLDGPARAEEVFTAIMSSWYGPYID